VKWEIELAKFGLQFTPRHAVKSQALADIERSQETVYPAVDDDKPWTLEYWCMNFEGSLTLQEAGAVVVLASPD
jgi:hypothetical protein